MPNILAQNPKQALLDNFGILRLIAADPAGFLIKGQREFCRAWPNQQAVTVKGAHFLQEDSPHEVGDAMARFVAKVLAGQTRAQEPETRKAV